MNAGKTPAPNPKIKILCVPLLFAKHQDAANVDITAFEYQNNKCPN
jgi:hypothetical protein